MSTTPPQAIYLQDYTVPDFSISDVFLHFDIQDKQTAVSSVLSIKRNPSAGKQNVPLILNGEDMQLVSVAIDGIQLTDTQYKVDATCLTIAEVPAEFKLEIHVTIKPHENTCLMGLYKSRDNLCTQCESHGFRRITYYLDRPDVLARFSTTITADKDKFPYLLSNGNLIEQRELEGNRHWVHWEDPSLKPCYLFALVAGDFDVIEDQFKTCSGRMVELRFYLEKGFKEEGYYAVASLKRAMLWDEQTYGREYELDIYMVVAVSDFNMGAMENKGLNVFNTKYVLANDETATDADYVAIEDVIGHEYFHNWSGNRITCRDWFQLTLKEGLTVFRDQSFSTDMTSDSIARLAEINVVRTQQFAEDAGPLAHPIRPASYIEINNFYTLTVYRKGAEVIRMVQTLLTPTVFRQGMDLYFSRHDGQAVTTDDFIQAMQDASGKDLTQFKRWYSQAGTPVLDIQGHFDAAAKTFTLQVKQSCPATPGQADKEALHMPLNVGLIGTTQGALPLQLKNEAHTHTQTSTCILELTEQEQSFTFMDVAQQPIPSLLRNFSAPVKVNYPYSDKELARLHVADTDAFAQVNAGQKLMVNCILEKAEHLENEHTPKGQIYLHDAFTELLTTEHTDLSLLTRLCSLPCLNYFLQFAKEIDIDAIVQIHQTLNCYLATNLTEHWQTWYQKFNQATPYQFSVEAMGQRAIKNLSLAYLTATKQPEFLQTAYTQFQQADNMTDTMGALMALNGTECEQRDLALSMFYEKWQHEPLVVNKWLSLQASATLNTTLNKVTGLLNHAAFNIKNPNNVYALLGSVGGNVACMHQDKQGATYQFIADLVLKIDAFNPQVAVRVVQPLIGWQRLDEERGQLMREQLQKIATQTNLSADLYEISTKGLVEN